jgi:hypothetical protein
MNTIKLSFVMVCMIYFTSSMSAAPIRWSAAQGGNGHWYDVVRTDDGIPWATARDAAANSTLNGFQGYLATVTSQAENDFLVDTFADAIRGTWLGGFQPLGNIEPTGGWQWITGEPFIYTNWAPGEPNNSGGSENNLDFATAGSSVLGVWNDLNGVTPPATFVGGYVVEYVPELPSSLLIALAAVCFSGIGMYKRLNTRLKDG